MRVGVALVLGASSLQAASSPMTSVLDNTRSRYQAVAPLADSDASKIAEQAEALEVSEDQLDFWRRLFVAYGRPGLLTTSDLDAETLARHQEGSWHVTSLVMNGRELPQSTWLFNEVLESSPKHARLRSLMLETSAPRGGSPVHSLGAFGIIDQKKVTGPDHGLPDGRSGVHQVFEFELRGMQYPGLPAAVRGRTESLWVRQGGVVRAVSFEARYFDAEGEAVDRMTIDTVSIEMVDEVQITVFPAIDFEQTQKRVEDSLLVTAPLADIWQQAASKPGLLDARRWLSERGDPAETADGEEAPAAESSVDPSEAPSDAEGAASQGS